MRYLFSPLLSSSLVFVLNTSCASNNSEDPVPFVPSPQYDASPDSNTLDAPADSVTTDTASDSTPDSSQCSTGAPLPNAIDACLVSHRPSDPSHLSEKRPTAVQPVVIRLETKANDVESVVLRTWTGWLRNIPMTKLETKGEIDIFEAKVPASGHPVYYRFELHDGTASVTLGATSTGDFVIAPVPSAKTVHYKSGFSSSELLSSDGTTTPMSPELAGWVGATGLSANSDLEFHVGEAKGSAEDRPPGGGDYEVRGDFEEVWLEKGVIFDMPPDLLDLSWLDCHTHPFNRAANGDIIYDPAPVVQVLPKNGIRRAITMVGGPLASQDAMISALHNDNRWLTPVIWVNPKTDAVNDVRNLLKTGRYHGLKFHPVVDGYLADDPMMDVFLDLAAEQHVPIQVHSATDENSKVSRIVNLAKKHPTVKVVLIHTELGANDKTQALKQILSVPNIYAETSWTNPESILQIMDTLDSSRTLFGTDATVDGFEHFTKKSTANPKGEYVYSIPEVMAQVQTKANPGAFENWSHLTAIRLFRIRFRPDPDLFDTDGDGIPDQKDTDADQDGFETSNDAKPQDPGAH